MSKYVNVLFLAKASANLLAGNVNIWVPLKKMERNKSNATNKNIYFTME